MSTGLFAADAAKEKLDQINTKIEKNRQKIQQKEREKRQAERALVSVTRELRYTELRLSVAKRNLRDSQYKVAATRSQLGDLQKQYNDKSGQFSRRLVDIYKNRNLGFLEFLFSPERFVSLVDSSYYFDRIVRQDTALIQDMKARYKNLEVAKTRYEAETQRIEGLKQQISSEESNLSAQRQKHAGYVSALASEIEDMERKNRELEASSEEIARLLRGTTGKHEVLGTGSFIRPASGFLSSRFGVRRHPIFKRLIRHMGVDFASGTGTPIYAADSGVVVVAGAKPIYHGYGNITIIDHGNRGGDSRRFSTIYAHQSRIVVSEGQSVKQGQLIGYVGSTGYATGPHLHFEVRIDGVPVDPLRYLQ